MKKSFYLILLTMWMTVYSTNTNAQDSSSVKKHTPAKTVWDIPHKTVWQKWMWIHRSAVFVITKERTVNYDTSYIKSYYKRLIITLPVSTRFLNFSLVDHLNGKKLNFAPNLQYNLGLSLSSRWASFILNSGLSLVKEDNSIKGKTKYQDYQLNLYNRKFTTDIFVQYYIGFYIKNSRSYNSYSSSEPYAIRSDVNALHIGVNSYYIVNHKRFSYGNSFAFVEQQKKSAGSLLLGVYYSYFSANGSPSLLSPPFQNSFDTLSYIHNGHTQNFGINLGCIYTFVFLKRCYITASLVQGIGGEQMNYQRVDNSTYNKLIGNAGKLNMRLALGYDNGRYFIGAMGMTDYYLFNANSNSSLDYSLGKFMLYIGYRFSVLKIEHKILHHFKLIDY